MPITKRKTPHIGDVIEIPLSSEFAYARYTHVHSRYGALLRAYAGTYDDRPLDFETLAEKREVQFSTFFPLRAACRQGIVSVVAETPIPSSLRDFPTFRARAVLNDSVGPWWLWDGEREWVADVSGAELLQLPIRGVWNDTLLIERIEAGWRSADIP